MRNTKKNRIAKRLNGYGFMFCADVPKSKYGILQVNPRMPNDTPTTFRTLNEIEQWLDLVDAAPTAIYDDEVGCINEKEVFDYQENVLQEFFRKL